MPEPRWIATGLVLLVAFERLVELRIATTNARRLAGAGWSEVGAGHYPLLVILHATWLASCAWAAWTASAINWPLAGLFVVLQVGRAWVISSLGRYWTTRIYTNDDEPLVRRGPYRFLRHPNYLIVVLEIAVLPLVFGAWAVALVFSILNAGVLALRIRVENRALSGRSDLVEG